MNPLVLGVISALVAHRIDAVEDMLQVLARQDPKQAADVLEAINRGNKARKAVTNGG